MNFFFRKSPADRSGSMTSNFINLLRSPSKSGTMSPTLETLDDNDPDSDLICNMEENPIYIMKLISKGWAEELEKLLKKFPKIKNITKDSSGQGLWHHACLEEQLSVMDVLIANGLDINMQDNKGNTPLHIAVMQKKLSSINYLIVNGADTSIKNNRNSAPIHLACERNDQEVLRELLAHKEVDINLPGSEERTAVHYCCAVDAEACLRMLIARKAKICSHDISGTFPIHVAIKSGSINCLNAIIEYVVRSGCMTRKEMMNRRDMEGNVPLHTAVNTEDIKCVKMCLENEAEIDKTQEDLSTPVHFACTKGLLEIVELMFTCQPERVQRTLMMKDNNGRTPLHRAAMYNHGSDMEVRDQNDWTPLLLAASKCAMDSCTILIKLGANYRCRDSNERNLAHLVILAGLVNLSKFHIPIESRNMLEMVNEGDAYGCTPLHYATQQGYLKSTHHFISLGATCVIQNHEKSTPLHFAARYGRYNTCVHLLNTPGGMKAINCTDSHGLMPLHVAALNGHVKVVQLLYESGCIPGKCFHGNSSLHFAAINGHLQTAKYLLSVNPSLLDLANRSGMTALHFAALNNHAKLTAYLLTLGATVTQDKSGYSFFSLALREKNVEVAREVVLHERWPDIMTVKDEAVGCPILGLIKEMPLICMLAMDKSVQITGNPSDKDFRVDFNFRLIQHDAQAAPLIVVRKMVEWGRVDLLRHPLCDIYLRLKWQQYGQWVHQGTILFYLLFLVSLTYLACSLNPMQHYDPNNHDHCQKTLWTVGNNGRDIMVNTIIVVVFVCISIPKEIIQMFYQTNQPRPIPEVMRLSYFLDPINYLEWSLYISSGVFVFPLLFGYSLHFQIESQVYAVFMAWFNFLLYMQRLEMFGIYVVMFLEILKTLLQALIVFSVLIFAFAFSFFILLNPPDIAKFNSLSYTDKLFYEECYIGYQQWNSSVNLIANDTALQAWSNPGLAIFKTIMMMVGEFDYLDTITSHAFDNDPVTLHFSGLTYFGLVAFIIFMPILLINLLIGLAVGDIESVRQNAVLKRIAMQVTWLSDLESKFSVGMRDRLYRESYSLSPNAGPCKKELFEKVRQTFKGRENVLFGGGETSKVEMHLQMQEKKLKDIQNDMNKQSELLRLIVQKMEIDTEADERDEGTPVQLMEMSMKKSASKVAKMRATSMALTRLTPSLSKVES